jgi:lactate dehydrogenase-like 2-hydroxyacid dehydrogenase
MEHPKIFIPQPIPANALRRLQEIGDVTLFERLDSRITREEVLAAVADQHILFALGDIPYDEAVIAASADLRLIAAMHVSATFVDIAAATRRGVPVTGIPNTLAETTGEFTFALLVSTAWRIPEADRFLRDGRWVQTNLRRFLAADSLGRQLGLSAWVGLAWGWRAVARRWE